MAFLGPAEEAPVTPRPRKRTWRQRLVVLGVLALAVLLLLRVVGDVNWNAVGAALSHLSWWHPLPLLGVLLVRVVCSALSLKFYVPGITVWRASISDLGGTAVATVVPPPSDLALRVAMFHSWGVSVSKGAAGAVMKALTFYIVRFATPAGGIALLLLIGEPPGLRWVEVLSILISATIFVLLVLVLRSEGLARSVGAGGARLVGRVRGDPDPGAWAERCATFRSDVAERFRRGFPRSVLGLLGMLAADLTLLTLCIRFVGVSPTTSECSRSPLPTCAPSPSRRSSSPGSGWSTHW